MVELTVAQACVPLQTSSGQSAAMALTGCCMRIGLQACRLSNFHGVRGWEAEKNRPPTATAAGCAYRRRPRYGGGIFSASEKKRLSCRPRGASLR